MSPCNCSGDALPVDVGPAGFTGEMDVPSSEGATSGVDSLLQPTSPKAPPPPVTARDLRISEVALYQAVKVSLARDGQPVVARNAPVIVGKEGFLRVFVEPLPGFSARPIRAELTLLSTARSGPVLVAQQRIATLSRDEDLASTINFDIPAGVIDDDTRWSVQLWEVNPTGIDGAADSQARYPAAAETFERLGARDAGPLRVMVVPYRFLADGSRRLPAIDEAQLELFRQFLHAYYPITEVQLELHAPVDFSGSLNSTNGWAAWLDAHCQLREREAPDPKVLYYGLTSPTSSPQDYLGGVGGVSYLPGPAANFGRCSVGLGFEGPQTAFIMAHELGHSLGLPHAPCGVSAPPFPYAQGRIGSWGFGLGSRSLKDPDEFHDLMSYCEPAFISDFNFQKLFERVRYLNLQFGPAELTAPKPQRYTRILQLPDGQLRVMGQNEMASPPGGDDERRDLVAWDAEDQRLEQPVEGYFIPTGEQDSGVWFVPDVGAKRVAIADLGEVEP